MKTYSIGRDLNCDIVINDSTDVISRRHALLNITSSGKMTIVDQSSNGTYVNGIRITQNVPVPVTRKDIVSLAHVAKLDWDQVPKSNQWIKYTLGAAAAVVVILGLVWGAKSLQNDSGDNGDASPLAIEKTDSTDIKQKEAAKLDSIKTVERQDSIKVAQDSIEKARQDSIKATKKATPTKKLQKKDNADEGNAKEDSVMEDSSKSTLRAIG